MNELGISLVWLAAQVTLLCTATAAIYLVARRRHPAAGATAALTGLLLSALLTLGVFSPWPHWSLRSDSRDQPIMGATGSASDAASWSHQQSNQSAASDAGTASTPGAKSDADLESPAAAALSAFWQGVRRELTQPSTQPANAPFRWPAWLAVSLVLAMLIGAMRLIAGWISVRGCIRRSRPIGDRSLNETLDVLRAELGCRRHVELRESHDVASAATVGWRKPLILLPPDWRGWSDRERRAVLAHELAHVTAGDAATWLAAQVGLLLHFYHPLEHWLTHRLRLEQELAADALAARLTGSSQTYLTTLAELAVRQPDRRIAWPARAFLPTRGTLLRRIEMLRDTKTPPLRSSMLRRGTVITLTLAAGVFVAGLRPPQAQQALAQQRAAGAQGAAKPQAGEESGFNLENVPASTIALLGMRPAKLIERPEIRPLAALIDESLQSDKTGIFSKDVDQLLVGVVGGQELYAEPPSPPTQVIEIRMTQPTDFSKYIETLRSGQIVFDAVVEYEVNEAPSGRRSALKVEGNRKDEPSPHAQMAFRPDERTLLIGSIAVLSGILNSKREGRKELVWSDRFDSVSRGEVGVVWDVSAVRSMIQQSFERRPDPFVGMFAPLWQKTDLVIGGAKVDDRLTLTVNGWAASAEDAARLEKTLAALVPFATGLLETAKASAKQGPPEMQAMLGQSFGLAQQALDDMKVQTTGDRVTVTVDGDAGSVATLAAAMLPALQQAREAARRTRSMNNLKQIGLAMHNYHDTFGHFPPPVLYGSSGNGKSKHPHSWRVAILPFVDQAALYNLYNFDEPWDSEHNLKIAAQVPAVFRSPNDDSGSTNAAYYVLVGENTAVGDKPEPDGNPTKGNALSTFTDGTSNTILVVEAKRDIPWTKPEDIPYSADADLPQLGGWTDRGFLAGLADGSVRFISENIGEKTLRALITRNGQEVLGNF
ncbi:MAG: DUF1559 domain-containing protein [Planctomycetaceae bacterium]